LLVEREKERDRQRLRNMDVRFHIYAHV
jgi:hypothetical protein